MDLRESTVTEMIQRDDRSKWLSYNNHNIKCFTEGEIERITNNFKDILGKGAFGEVYKGFLEDGSIVAVKKFVRNVEEDFAKELKVHSEINHKNVVRLIGYCAEENALMIVSEYISKGNLSDVLHYDCIPIMLDTRLRIAVECSEVLCYLHSQMYTDVVHGDIKPANILLDDNLNAKISDFGISRLVNTGATLFTNKVIGSIGYMDPLFARDGRITSKGDVYSFGIVLLELITRKKVSQNEGEINIVECFTKGVATGIRVRELFDVEISSQRNMKVLDGVAELARECLRMERDTRPEMADVVERLRTLRKSQAQGMTEMLQRANHNPNIKYFTKGEIGIITNNYRDIIGKGSLEKVYRGFLDDRFFIKRRITVAVKRFVRDVEEIFDKELKVNSEINHKNIVRLIGYCAEENSLMIITEYISQGNLSDVLHHDCTPIVLDTRLRIAVECSEALCYMHSQMYTQVIHGNIKPSIILLDDNFNAKISYFGISRHVNTKASVLTEHIIESKDYMDPLFTHDGCITSKSDVYSFGIVLLELITRKKASVKRGEIGVVECFTQALATGIRGVRELFDFEISSRNNIKVLEGVAKLAGECLRTEMDRRPEMIDVAERLQALRKSLVQGNQTGTSFSWGWRNKPAAQNKGQSSGASRVHVPQPFPAAENNGQSSDADGVHVSQSLTSNWCRQFSLEEMKSSTGNFDKSHLVGEGEHSKVYYGVIDAGATKVAIRCCRWVWDVRFQAQIVMMERHHYHHLVSLVGYSREYGEMILIYDFMARGSLRGKLYGQNTEEPPLSWRQRLNICIGVGLALDYLHWNSIIHRDLTTTNILLDEHWVAKVSCEISPKQHYTVEETISTGSLGYLDPEVCRKLKLTSKSDVYSFGVVLFEVLCARDAWDPTLPRNQVCLVEHALNCKKKGILDRLVDPHLEGKISPWCLNKFVETAEKCVADRNVDRPSVGEVIGNLQRCLEEHSRVDGTNRPSTEERQPNMKTPLSFESRTVVYQSRRSNCHDGRTLIP